MKIHRALILLVLLTTGSIAQVRVMPAEVRETRRTDGFFNKLEIELKLIGDAMNEAKGIRVILDKAVDDTGRDLLNPEKKSDEFDDISSSFGNREKIDIEMKNASRQAATVQEISGRIELFIPKRDPKSSLMFPGVLRATGKPLTSADLKAAGITITIWTKEQYEVRRKAEEARIKKEMEERKKKAAENPGDPADEMIEGLMKIFGGLFSALTEMGENAVALQLSDKQGKLISIEFEDAAGKPISRQGRSTMGSKDDQTQIFEFENKLPADARMRIYLLTPRSVVSTPFKLTNIPLP